MKPIDIVFNGPMGAEPPKVMKITDAELGQNIVPGSWHKRADGHHALRIMLTDKILGGAHTFDVPIIEAEEMIVRIPPSRDEIALEAMKIMLPGVYGRPQHVSDKIKEIIPGAISKDAYAIADAMIEAASG